MIPHSIRWRLSFSFAVVALVAALSLGAVLLTILRGYYVGREQRYLLGNAQVISDDLMNMVRDNAPPETVQSLVENLSFLSQTRVRVVDAEGQVQQDSGVPRTVNVAFGMARQIVLVKNKSDTDNPPQDFVQFISIGALPDAPVGVPITETISITKTDLRLNAPISDQTGVGPIVAYKSMPVAGSLYGFGLGTQVEVDGRRSDRVVRVQFRDDTGKRLGYVELSEGPAYGRDILNSVAWGWAIASAVAIVLAAGVGWFISRLISAPVLALTHVTTQMAQGDLAVRAEMLGSDELGQLGRSFNEMADRVESIVIALRRFASDAAHELHTPLTALRTNLELATNEPDESARVAFMERAQAQVVRLESLTSELLDLSRIESGAAQNNRAPLDLVELTQLTCEPYASRAEQAGIELSLDLPAQSVIVNGNEAQLRRALGNLLDNACKFTPADGAINMRLRREGPWAELCVQDTGLGIPADDLPQLFSRFHRASNAAIFPGSGLGLAIVKAIVVGHGGQVTVENTSPGTRFCVRLPLADRMS